MGTDLSWCAVRSPPQRKKTMGTFTSETDYPLDSAIYWIGSGICNFRILEGHMKNGKKKGGPKDKCVLITKRDKWVEYLHRKQSQINTAFFNTDDKTNMASVQQSQEEIREMIAAMITTLNKSWTKRKKTSKIQHSQKLLWPIRMSTA